MSAATDVEILSRDKILKRYPLNKDRRVEVPGPLGTSEVIIKEGACTIKFFPMAPHKTCMAMGDIGTEAGILVCLPNEIVVRVGNGQPDGLDAVSR